MFGAKKPDFSALGKSFIDKMSKGTGTSVATTGGGSNALVKQDVSPLATMKEMFADMRDSLQSIQNNTLETVELLKVAVMGTEQQQKQDKIKAGDVDGKEKGPGILSRAAGGIKSAVSFLTPESGGLMSTLLKLGLAVGAIALLKIFGDKAVGPLGNLIKAFKEGKLGEKIGEIVTDIQEYLTPLWTNIKIKTGEFIDGVKLVFGLIMGAAKAVNDYVMSFDTKGTEHPAGAQHGEIPDGKIDAEEKQNMIKDVTTRISEAIMGFVGNIGSIIIDGFLLYILGGTALNLLMKKGATAAGATMFLKGGVFSMAIAATAIAAGIYKLAKNTMTAYDAAVTDELGNPQDFAMKEFVSTLLVGKETGNKLKDTMKNAADKAIIGGSIGFVIGGPLGAAVGALAGGLVGGFATYLGGPKVQQMIDGAFGENSIIGSTVNTLVDTYKLLILNPFEYLFGKLGEENDSFMARMGYDFDAMSGKPLDAEDRHGENVNKSKLEKKSTVELLSILNENKIAADKLQPKRNAVNIPFFGPLKIGAFDKQLTGDQQNDLKGHKLIIKKTEKELLERGINLNTGDLDMSKADMSNSQFVMDKYIADRLINLGATNLVPAKSGQGKGAMIIGNNNDSSVKSQTSNSIFAGLTVGNPNSTAEIINKRYLVAN